MRRNNSPIRLVVADEQACFRDGLRALMAREKDFQVVADADDALAAAELVMRRKPVMALLDVDMPGVSAFEAARSIRRHRPLTKIVFLATDCNDSAIARAISVRAHGYILKSERFVDLRDALREIMAGRIYFSEEVRQRIAASDDEIDHGMVSRVRRDLLSPREQEVIHCLAQGMSTREIAGALLIAQKTVENHKTRLMGKLDLHDRVQLTRYAIREGLVRA